MGLGQCRTRITHHAHQQMSGSKVEPDAKAMTELSLDDTSLPTIIVLLGAPGVGKTTMGNSLKSEFPEQCTFLSIGEELRARARDGTTDSVESIVAKAYQEGQRRNVRYVFIDGSFRADGLMMLLELSSKVFVLYLKTDETDIWKCAANIKRRGRPGDSVERLASWRRHSPETLRAANLLGMQPLSARTSAKHVMSILRNVPDSVLRCGLVGPISSKQVMDRMRVLLKVHSPKFAMPIALADEKDIEFVCINNYFVTRKADGVRQWLFRDEMDAYAWSRDGTFCSIDADLLPTDTILDVEKMADGTFLVFDVLVLSGAPVWYKSLTERIVEMSKIPASARLKIKPQHDLKETTNILLGEFSEYPTDGLVFTPDIHYCFDGAVPLFKLQQPTEMTFDLDATTLRQHRFIVHPEPTFSGDGGIAVCVFEEIVPVSSSHPWRYLRPTLKLKFQHMRYDKRTPNSNLTIHSQIKLCLEPLNVNVAGLFTPRRPFDVPLATSFGEVHPAKRMSWEQLQANLALPNTESTLDSESGLTVFNNYSPRPSCGVGPHVPRSA